MPGLTTIVQWCSIQIGFLVLSGIGIILGFGILAIAPGTLALG